MAIGLELFRFRWGLRLRLFGVLLLITLPALGIVLYTGLQQRGEAGRLARENALAMAQAVSGANKITVAQARQLLETLAALPVLQKPDPASCGAYLATLLHSGSTFVNLGLAGLNGQVLCSALEFHQPVNLADRAFFQEALAGDGFAVGDYQVGRITGVASVNFGYPVRDEQGAITGVVFAALPLAKLAAYVNTARLPEGSEVLITDANDIVLWRDPDPGPWLGKRVTDSPLFALVRGADGEGTVEAMGLDGTERLYGFTSLSDVAGSEGLHVIVGLPKAFAYTAQNRALAMTAGTAVGLVALLLSVGWWGSGAFVLRPVRQLLATSQRLGDGDLSARTRVPERAGEVSELARAFNAMAADLEERDRQIRSQVDHIARLNRLYAMLSGSNRALTRIRDEEGLFAEVCRVAVSKGGFRYAWAAKAQGEPRAFHPLVQSGAGPVNAAELAVPVAPCGAAEKESLGEILLAGQPAVLNRLSAGEGGGPFPKALAALGCKALAAFPVRKKDGVAAALFFAASEEDFFQREEVDLLREVAADMSLGLEIIENERELADLAYRDRITGLPNRPMFERRLAEAVEKARDEDRYLGVQMIGIAGLPDVDGTMGPFAGDEMLAEVAECLSGLSAGVDTVAWVGREGFGIVLGNLPSPDDISRAAAAVMDAVPAVVSAGGIPVSTRPHSGLAVYPYDGADAEELIRRALLAHHRALRARLEKPLFYSEEFEAEPRERRKIEGELRFALERGEFALHYQPIVSLSNGNPVGIEALLRWHSPYLGPVSPAKFVPIAEESLLIRPIGAWVLKTACEQAQRWARAGLERLKVSVNVSVVQLHERDFFDGVRRISEEAGYDPSRGGLQIEITESRIMENVEFFARLIKEMKGLGVSVTIDDFGTGYSSLNRIKELDVDGLKIDLSFVRDLERDAEAVTLVRGIVAMAHALDLEIVAEGVETEGQAAILRELGCDFAQGYLFGRPGPAEEIARFLAEGARGRGSAEAAAGSAGQS